MTRHVLSLAAGAALLMTAGAVQAQTPPQVDAKPGQSPQSQAQPGAGMPMMTPEMMQMMLQQGAMRPGAGPGAMRSGMGRDGTGRGMTGHGPALRIMFAVVDENGDGALSLEEVQAFHARIFRAVDADDDGALTQAEVRDFMTGAPDGTEDAVR